MERAALVLASLWGLGLHDLVSQSPAHRSAITRSLLGWLGDVASRPPTVSRHPRRAR